MAGGRGSRKEGGSLDNAIFRQCQQQQRHHRHRRQLSNFHQEPIFSECFRKRRRIEAERTYLQNVQTLQRDIVRIFTDSRHSDFHVIHGCSVVKTNDCILRTRSPKLYEILETHFVHTNNIIKCYIETPEIYQRIKDFSRLLYSNLDVEQDERILVEFILSVKNKLLIEDSACTDYTFYPKERTCDEISYRRIDLVELKSRSVKNEDGGDLSVSISEMADSGLETGSASPLENTESENSVTDHEESHCTDYVSMDDDFIKISLNGEIERSRDLSSSDHVISVCHGNSCDGRKKSGEEIPTATRDDRAGCSSIKNDEKSRDSCNSKNGNETTTTTTTSREIDEEITRYENDVLSDPFYEDTDCPVNDENSFVPTESFEFVEPTTMSPTTSAPNRRDDPNDRYEKFGKIIDEKVVSSQEARSMTVEELRHELSHSNDQSLKKSSSSVSSYYFIDASSLNDEEEIASLSNIVAKELRDSRGNLTIYTSTTSNYPTSTRITCGISHDEQNYKLTARKLSSSVRQDGHERVAEFEREIKMTEFLKPIGETRKVKRVDSTSEDKFDLDKANKIEKETLVVEIKEADSGESNNPSPCSDNNAKELGNKMTEERKVDEDIVDSRDSRNVKDDSERRPSLIRRNTFELDSNDEKMSVLRQEYERRQGHLLFQSSIPQYSGHRVDGDSCFEPPPPQNHDLSASSIPLIAEIVTKYAVDVPNGAAQYSSVSTRSSIVDDPEIGTKLRYVSRDVPGSRNCQVSETKSAKFGSIESPEEMTSWAAEVNSSRPIVADDEDDDDQRHNDTSPSDKLPLESCSESDDGSRNCCKSLPISLCSETIRERRSSTTSIKRTKRDEATPILSGGVSTVDYTRPSESPIVKRKTESTPIVSGGSVIMNEQLDQLIPRPKTTRMASSMTAWIVDMSDCAKNNSGKTSPGKNGKNSMSQSFTLTDTTTSDKGEKKFETKHSSLGYFVNLNDIDSSNDKTMKNSNDQAKKVANDCGKQSCEFFVDISKENADGNSNVAAKPTEKLRTSTDNNDRKNIFSMFIDLKEPSKDKDDDIRPSRLFDKRADPRSTSKMTIGDSGGSSSNSQTDQTGSDNNNGHGVSSCSTSSNNNERTKPSVFMFIESDSPVVRRRAMSSSRPAAFQRHSWNVEKSPDLSVSQKSEKLSVTSNGQLGVVRREHKRAHSVSVDRGDIKRLQNKSSNSSHSLSEVARADTLNGIGKKRLNDLDSSRNTDTSTEEVFEYDCRDTPPNSHVETIVTSEDIRENLKNHYAKEPADDEVNADATRIVNEDEISEISLWEKTATESTEGHTRKSETFDISSGSGDSPEIDNHRVFDIDDMRPGEMTNYDDIMKIETTNVTKSKVSETHKSLTETIKKIECELKKPEYGDYERDTSDSVTPISRKDTKSSSRGSKDNNTAKSMATMSFVRLSDLDKTPARSRPSDVTSREDRTIYRMSNSIPETSWVESKLAVNRTNAPVRSVTRKFGAIMSTSLPAKHKSPIDDADCEAEGLISESDLSSMQSSMGRSGADVSTEETETSSMGVTKPYNRLGEDLLRMFLEEINPDVTIDVAGRRIRAHKCILSSRCQYFAAILSGGWIESTGNVISLQGYSYNAVHFALCHIYSGESNIPETLSIVELATLADMLCLEGLKEVIGYTLKAKYCHLFHKPCQICSVGVLECMPLAAAYGLDEVYRKSLRWITRHFVRIWPCKAFATLPRELMDKCYHQHIVHMSTDNVIQTMMDCDKLLATLPNVRWAEPVFRMVSNLLETTVKYISENFSGVLGNENFQSLGRDLTWNISRLEDNFLAAADRLPPDQACKSYSKLNKMLIAAGQIEEPQIKPPWSILFVDFLRKINSRVEKCLVKEASRAARTTTWLKMDLELRRRIQELACLVILPNEPIKRPSRHSNFLKEPRVPSTRTPASRSLDLRRVKMAISEHNDKTTTAGSTTVTKSLTSVTAATVGTSSSAPSTAHQVKKPFLIKPKSDPLERKNPQEEKHAVSDSVALRPKSWPNKLEVKSRYLEPRNKSVTKENVPQSQHDRVMVQQRRKIMISSSDSSRTSSPAMKRASDKKPLVKMKLTIKKDVKALSSDSLAEGTSARGKREGTSKSCGITRPESPSLRQKEEIGLSADSLAESRKKPTPPPPAQQATAARKKPQAGKMDTSMSTDSLMADLATTPKSSCVSSKVSPTLGRAGASAKTQIYDRAKKSSPPLPQKSQATTTTTAATSVRRLPRTLECSTAASRNRAAAISAYHGSPNLRRNLLDAAKTPDVPATKNPTTTTTNGSSTRTNSRQQSVSSSLTGSGKSHKRETLSNQPSTESPSRRSSPKLNGTHRPNRATSVPSKRPLKVNDERTTARNKCHNADSTKQQPTVGSRSGTFLKDEPTILKKSDIKNAQISGS